MTARIEAYAIVSEDGMLADAAGVVPDSLKIAADQDFFARGLDGVDVVVQGRHSGEEQPHSAMRHRIIATRQIASVAPDPSNARAVLWNPEKAPFEQALALLKAPVANIAIIGGTEVFGLFLGRYDFFYLSRVPKLRLPGGRPVFPAVPAQTPEQVLSASGMERGPELVREPMSGLTIVRWQRASQTQT